MNIFLVYSRHIGNNQGMIRFFKNIYQRLWQFKYSNSILFTIVRITFQGFYLYTIGIETTNLYRKTEICRKQAYPPFIKTKTCNINVISNNSIIFNKKILTAKIFIQNIFGSKAVFF